MIESRSLTLRFPSRVLLLGLQSVNIAGLGETLDAQQLGRLDQREQEVGWYSRLTWWWFVTQWL